MNPQRCKTGTAKESNSKENIRGSESENSVYNCDQYLLEDADTVVENEEEIGNFLNHGV